MVEVYRPESLEEALEMADREKCTIFAGGTDLMVKKRKLENSCGIVFISNLNELKIIKKDGNYLRIGAACTLRQLAECDRIPGLMGKVFNDMASPSIRNVATIGGNICNSSPAGDSLPLLYALDGEIVLKSIGETRKLPIEHFITGPGQNELRQGEILTEVLIPVNKYNLSTYRKVGTRKAAALSKLSFIGLAGTSNGKVDDLRLAFGAVGPTVVRSREAEEQIIRLSREGIPDREKVREIFGSLIKPIDDQRSTAFYRKEVCLRLLDDFIFNKVTKYIECHKERGVL